MATSSSSLNQPASSSLAPSALYAQPTKNWVIPPRPKPGRKPKKDSPKVIDDDATDEARKNQNRASQRAFRERRQDQLATLQARLQQYEQGETERYIQLQAIDKRLKDENDSLRAELAKLQEENLRLKAEKAAHWANSKPEANTEHCPPVSTSRKRVTSTTSDAGVQSARKRSKTAISPPRGFDHHTDETYSSFRHSARSMSSSGPFAIPHVPVSPVISMASSGLTPPLSTSATTPSSQDQSVTSPESQGSPSTSTIPSKTPIAASTPCPSRHMHNSQAMHPFPSSASGPTSSAPDSPPPPSEDATLVITNCGFCTDDTPCICREISRQGARQEDILSISKTFGTMHDDVEEDVVVPSPQSSILDNLPPYQPPVPLRKRAAQQASASSSSSSTLATALRTLKEPIFAVHPPNQPSVEAQAKLAATCSGDPSNCPVCKDDSFGQAFCSALSSACSSGRCENCPSRQRQGLMPGLPPPEAMQPLCGSAPLGPPTTMPRSSAWATLKAHPASKTFNNLDLLAEVVVRGNNSRPGSRLSTRSTGEKQHPEPEHPSGDAAMSNNEVRPPCGERMVEVPMEGVRDALAILDEHWKDKGGRD